MHLTDEVTDVVTQDLIDEEHELALQLLEVTHISMWEMLRRSAARWPDRPAVAMDGDEWTYAELRDRSLVVARRLGELGVGYGTRVAFLFHACPEWAALHYALARLGAVAVPINLMFERTEIQHVLETAQPELVITIDEFRGASFADKLRSVDSGLVDGSTAVATVPSIRRVVVLPLGAGARPRRDSVGYELVFGTGDEEPLPPTGVAGGHDPAYIVFTSGSTAAPKAALCSHRAFLGRPKASSTPSTWSPRTASWPCCPPSTPAA